MAQEKPKCKTCNWIETGDEGEAICKRSAPAPHFYSKQHRATWPRVESEKNACKDYEEKQ